MRVPALPSSRGKKNKEYEAEKEEQFTAQQAMLKKRRSGDAIKEANVRRQQVAVSALLEPWSRAAGGAGLLLSGLLLQRSSTAGRASGCHIITLHTPRKAQPHLTALHMPCWRS